MLVEFTDVDGILHIVNMMNVIEIKVDGEKAHMYLRDGGYIEMTVTEARTRLRQGPAPSPTIAVPQVRPRR